MPSKQETMLPVKKLILNTDFKGRSSQPFGVIQRKGHFKKSASDYEKTYIYPIYSQKIPI